MILEGSHFHFQKLPAIAVFRPLPPGMPTLANGRLVRDRRSEPEILNVVHEFQCLDEFQNPSFHELCASGNCCGRGRKIKFHERAAPVHDPLPCAYPTILLYEMSKFSILLIIGYYFLNLPTETRSGSRQQ